MGKTGRIFRGALCLTPYAGMLLVLFLSCAAACAGAEETVFSFRAAEAVELSGWFSVSGGEEITVDWGDGTRKVFTDGRTNYSYNYGQKVTADVKIYAGSESFLTGFGMDRATDGKILFDLDDIPGGVENFDILCANEITGDISDLPGGLTLFRCRGSNTITGDIADLPESLTFFSCFGENTISGNIRGLPKGLTVFRCLGANTVTGDIADLPESLRHFRVLGSNTVGGDIADLPEKLTHLDVRGSNAITGNLASLSENVASFTCAGATTVTGDIADLPAGLTLFDCQGSNTVAGNIGELPEGLVYFRCIGSNTVTGDIADLPEGLNYFDCFGSNTISDYTAGRNWAEGMRYFRLLPETGYGLSTSEVDSLLLDLSRTEWASPKRIWIAGPNESRSSASDEAIGFFLKEGVSVTVRERGFVIER